MLYCFKFFISNSINFVKIKSRYNLDFIRAQKREINRIKMSIVSKALGLGPRSVEFLKLRYVLPLFVTI